MQAAALCGACCEIYMLLQVAQKDQFHPGWTLAKLLDSAMNQVKKYKETELHKNPKANVLCHAILSISTARVICRTERIAVGPKNIEEGTEVAKGMDQEVSEELEGMEEEVLEELKGMTEEAPEEQEVPEGLEKMERVEEEDPKVTKAPEKKTGNQRGRSR